MNILNTSRISKEEANEFAKDYACAIVFKDKFMSNWGMSNGKANYVVLLMKNRFEAQNVISFFKNDSNYAYVSIKRIDELTNMRGKFLSVYDSWSMASIKKGERERG